MDEIPHWLDTFLRMFDRALEHGAFISIFLGYVIAIGLTQWLKRLPWTSSNKWIIRLMALPFGFAATYALWPIRDTLSPVRICMALAVGVSAPWIYQVVTRVLYWKWPHLERKLSAAPADDDL